MVRLGLGSSLLIQYIDILGRGNQENRMKLRAILTIVMGVLGAAAGLCQTQPPAGPRTGPGVQAPQDAREPEVLKSCKPPPQARGGRGGPGRGPGGAPAATSPREY